MSSLVQAIAVTPGTHFETIAAVATASACAAAERPGDPLIWEAWFVGAFTKSVRRAKRPAQIAKLEADPLVVNEHAVGSAKAYAYPPMPYEIFPKHLRQLQVSGLDIDRGSDRNPDYWQADIEPFGDMVNPILVISDRVEMSTGKAAAQVAHALVAWVQLLPSDARAQWANRPALRIIHGELDCIDSGHAITIADNGLTEIEPGTSTVRIALP